jgi:hypothetical protein
MFLLLRVSGRKAEVSTDRFEPPQSAPSERSRQLRDELRLPGGLPARSQPPPLRFVATSWQHPYRPYCPMCPESGRYERFGRQWTYLHFLYKVEGLVLCIEGGGSSPLERIGNACKLCPFGARADEPMRRHGGPWQRCGNTRTSSAALAILVVFMPLSTGTYDGRPATSFDKGMFAGDHARTAGAAAAASWLWPDAGKR